MRYRPHDLTAATAVRPSWQELPAAEGKALLHGDINQSNLLIASAGAVVVIDWHTAHLACHGSTHPPYALSLWINRKYPVSV
jgi:RIO-like serine/threonine protein kinase